MNISEEIKADLQRAKVACFIVLQNATANIYSQVNPIARLGQFSVLMMVPQDLGIRSQRGRIQEMRGATKRTLVITRSDVFVVACFTRSETFILDDSGEVRHPTRSPCTMTPSEIVAECFGVPRIMPEYWRLKEDQLSSLLEKDELTTEEMLEIQHIKAEFEMDEEDEDDV